MPGFGQGPFGLGPFGLNVTVAGITAQPLASDLYRSVLPLAYADEENGGALLAICIAMMLGSEEIDSWVRDTPDGPGWSLLLDINRVPPKALRWLGQFIGVTVDQSLPVPAQYQQLRSRDGWRRGTPATIKKAVRQAAPLAGTQTVEIVERDSSAYHFAVFVYSDEIPNDITYQDLYDDYPTADDLLALSTYGALWLLSPIGRIEAAVGDVYHQGVKPAGVQYSLQVIPGSPATIAWSYLAVLLEFATYAAIWNRYQTYNDLYVNN